MSTYYIANNGCDQNDGLSPSTPWATLTHACRTVVGGDTVLLRRGDTFYGRVRPPYHTDPAYPTVFGAYGEGAKPIVSQYKAAKAGAWEQAGGLWRLNLQDPSLFTGNITELDTNVGFLKVDGRIFARNRFEADGLEHQWDFYGDGGYLYVRSEGDPSALAHEILIACNIGCMTFADCLTVEDIVFCGTGGHGINGSVNHATVRRCEFHELGGSILPGYGDGRTRYGNGVECWTDSSHVLVEDCRFSQIYDVAMTLQGNCAQSGWRHITFRRNTVANCQQSFEIWSDGEMPDTGFVDCVFEDNFCVDSGYCWGYDVRPNKEVSCHLLIYGLGCPLCDVTVRNNTFIHSRLEPIFKSDGPAAIPESYRIVDNTFIVTPDQHLAFSHGNEEESCAAFDARIHAENTVIEEAYTTDGRL